VNTLQHNLTPMKIRATPYEQMHLQHKIQT